MKQSHSAKNCERGVPLGCLKLQFVAKCQQNEGGPFEDKKFKKKSRTMPTKHQKGTL